jgi:hypothetical protein
MDNMPSREELRRRYDITEEDFQTLIRPQLPTCDSLQQEHAYIQKLGYWDRFEVWCKRTIIGNLLLAVILIGSVLHGIDYIDKYSVMIYVNGQQLISYVNDYTRHAKEKPIGYIVRKDIPPTEEDKHQPDPVIFTTGTQLYPNSGSWHPA